ncbi:SAM-dependent methyltransferase [Pelagibacterium sediminicola]|uniref:SAM-dependent methyltransferase n=1 Tax=Pelagibacterium sediminicola TaxID=2248761 RepID=UPI000E313B97|nr:SAM-dependent methyltransferase [Pelagibacterium sediminicola]
MAPTIFDRPLLARRLTRRASADDWVTRHVLDEFHERLSLITRDVEKAAILGPDATLLPDRGATANGRFTFETFATLAGPETVDAENLELPASDYQLIASVLDLQAVNNVPSYLEALRRHLAPDGLMMAAAIGGRSLTELRDAWLAADVEMSGGVVPRVAPMIDVRDAGNLLQRAGFGLPVTDVDTHDVLYADPLALMNDLHKLGATNPLAARDPRLTSPRRLMRAAEIYAEKFSAPDGRARATLEILWLSGWAPHESQQKPLQPGSAKASLKDVLGGRG